MNTPAASPYQYLTVRGHRLAYRCWGHDNGEPVLLIHAFASHSRSWEQVAATLAARGFYVVAPDLRGHGRSDRASSYALADFEQDLIALLEALAWKRASLVGHSLGGHLALRLATQVPERIARLVIEAAPVPPRDLADAHAMAAARPDGWRRALATLGRLRLLRRVILRQFDPGAALTVLPELRTPMPAWWARLGTLRSPCLLLASLDDGAISARQDLLAARIPGAIHQWIGSGHRLHGQHTEAFLDAVLPFLAGIVRKDTAAA